MICYLSGTAVCSKSKCIRARISRVSSKLACSSLAIVRRGGTVGGLKFSDLLGHWLRKALDQQIQFDRFSFNLVGSSAPWLMTAQTRPGTNSTSSSAIDNSSEELLDSWSKSVVVKKSNPMFRIFEIWSAISPVPYLLQHTIVQRSCWIVGQC